MVKTKESSSKRAVPVSGILSEVTGSDFPNDFLTWHDLHPYRIWVHSRKAGSAYKPLALELQWLGSKSSAIGDEERSTRLKLAILREGNPVDSQIGASTFRGIPVGSILEAHASLVVRQKLVRLKKTDRPIELVRDHESESFETFNLFLDGSGKLEKDKEKGPNVEIGANKRDALVIAYVYAEQCASGSKRPAALTAKLLNIKPNLVYVAVRIARRKGWLTESSSGMSGGAMTKEGMREFTQINGSYLYQEFINRGLKGLSK